VTELTWSPQSLRDIEAIRTYIAVDSVVYADAMVRRLVAAVERLKTFPESGRVVPERNDSEIREVIVRDYRIVYRRRPGSVEIAVVFHGAKPFPDLSP
jgi:addiction module RelE/StbE family toxin